MDVQTFLNRLATGMADVSAAGVIEFEQEPTYPTTGLRGEFPVTDFQAAGDGVTDDTTAFQAAIDTAWAVGGTVVVPPKTKPYKIGNLLLPDPASGGGRTLRIVGRGAPFVLKTGTTLINPYGSVLWFYKANGSHAIVGSSSHFTLSSFQFRDLTLVGPDTSATKTSGHGIYIHGTDAPSIDFQNVNVSYFGGGCGVWLDAAANSTIYNLRTLCCDTGFKGTNGFNSNAIIRLAAEYCHTYGIYLDNANSTTFVAPLIQSNEKTGLYITGCVNLAFLTPHFEANNTTATPATYALTIAATTGKSNQHLLFQDGQFTAAADKILLTDLAPGSGYITTDVRFEGGYANGVSSPALTIDAVYTSYTLIRELLAAAAVSDSGTGTQILYHGALVGQGRFGSLGVGNSLSATTLGSVAKKIQVYDASGASLGYIPVYDAIT